MVRVSPLLKQQLHDSDVATSASQGERGVVVVGGATVDLGPFLHEKLDRAQMAGTGSLHQRSAPTLRLMLLGKKYESRKNCPLSSPTSHNLKTYQFRSVFQEQIGNVGMTILASIGQSGVPGPKE